MKMLKMFLPLVESWCEQVGTDHFVLTCMPDHIIVAAMTPSGVVTKEFRTTDRNH
jgi:hypothetical protein